MINAKLDRFINTCRWCDATIVWADGPGGERIPFDADPGAVSEQGNWALNANMVGDRLVAAQPTAGQASGMRSAGIVLYSHHGLHCPYSDKWGKVKDHGKPTRRARGGRR